MTSIRYIMILLAAAVSAAAASAQIRIIPREQLEAVANPRHSADSGALSFVQKQIVAEPMNENDAPKSFTYRFTNVGSDTLHIRRLTTTCSCASAVAPVRKVAPGSSAEIHVRYNPKGHPGNFERKIFVYTQDGNEPAAVLRLSVNVFTGAAFSDEWPVQMGNIRLKTSDVTFRKGERAVERLRFINLSDNSVALQFDDAFLPECLSVRTEPVVVEPGKEGLILIAFNPAGSGVRERMKVIIKGLGVPPSKSSINVNVNNQ